MFYLLLSDISWLWISLLPSLMMLGGYVYIMTNKNKTTLYIGVTSDLASRVLKHRQHYYPQSFTARYNLTCCIYYEHFFSIEEAINRETQLKKWRREKKVQLINKMNPAWTDLWTEIHNW